MIWDNSFYKTAWDAYIGLAASLGLVRWIVLGLLCTVAMLLVLVWVIDGDNKEERVLEDLCEEEAWRSTSSL